MIALNSIISVDYTAKRVELERGIQSANEEIAEYNEYIAAYQRDIDRIMAERARLEALQNIAVAAAVAAGYPRNCEAVIALGKSLEGYIVHLGSTDDYNRSIRDHQANIARVTTRLIDRRRQLAMIAARENSVLTLQQFKAQLRGLSNVVKGSSRMYQTRDGHQMVSWKYSGVVMTVPSMNRNISTGENPVHLPLPNIVVHIDLGLNKIYLRPERKHKQQDLPQGMSGPVVHPHVLSRNEPCLGDFGGSLMESLTERDFGTAALVLLQYLRSCDPEDGAGKHWRQWLKLPEGMAYMARSGAAYRGPGGYSTWPFFQTTPDGHLRVIERQYENNEFPRALFKQMADLGVDHCVINRNGKNETFSVDADRPENFYPPVPPKPAPRYKPPHPVAPPIGRVTREIVEGVRIPQPVEIDDFFMDAPIEETIAF